MALNPFATPTGTPWTLPPSTLGTLFNTTARVTRLTTRWASPTGAFVNLKGTWASTSVAAANTGFGHALKYLATGTGSEATTAQSSALSEPAAGSQLDTDNPRMWSQSAPFVYAWCNGGLSGAQNTALITRLESNAVSLENSVGALSKYLLDGPGNGNVGISGYIFTVIAAQGVAGFTDRRTNLRNLCQNMAQYLDESMAEGHWISYDFLFMQLANCLIAYHVATGEESLLATRCKFFAGRGEMLWRMMSGDNNNSYCMKSHNARLIGGAKFSAANGPEDTWSCAMQSDVTRDPLMTSMRDLLLAHGSPTPWSKLQLNGTSTWAGLLFYDDALTAGGQTPAQANTPKCKSFPVTGLADMRGGWNAATDLTCWFAGGPNRQNDHDHRSDGSILIKSGSTLLVWDGYDYPGRNANSTWEFALPVGSNEVGGFTMCKSSVSFSPSATQATREDRDGSASIVANNALSTSRYPLSHDLTNGVRQTWAGSTMGAMFDDGVLAKVTADLSAAFPQVTSAKRTVGYRRGTGSDKGTIIIYDQFTAPATIDHIRANFWSKVKPIPSGAETVLRGTTTAGIVQWAGNSVVIKSGSYQATIQMVTPFTTIHGVGGSGFESFFDSYTSSGGGNLDFVTAGGGDSRNPTQFAALLQNQWRTSFQTSQSTALGEMLFVITVDAAGTTAPTYTKTQALTLLVPSGGVTSMPGFSTFAQKQGLDFLSGNNSVGLPTLYAALFTTLPLDDGSGGVEVSGTGYARVQQPAGSFFSVASGGAPATTTNAAQFSFPVAGASWGTVVGVGFFDALTSGNYWGGDFLGTDPWKVFECTLASPGVLTSAGHGYSNGDLVEVTAKYGGTLPPTGGSWVGALTVANVTTNTFTVGVNTTSVGDGMVRKVLSQAVASAATVTIPGGSITLSLG